MIRVSLTTDEAFALVSELRTIVDCAEATGNDTHPQHLAAKRAMEKTKKALLRAFGMKP